jgi:iron complex outermembrane receptor protein
LPALATGLINPFGDSGIAGMQLLQGAQITGPAHEGRGYTVGIDGRASGTVASLPGGPLAVALGTEARYEHLENSYSAEFTSGDILGNGGDAQSVVGSRSAEAVFAEARIPLHTGWESQFAVRYDHYSDFGGTVNPKIALSWKPAPILLLRGSWGTGFRAPALYDLYTPVTHSFVDGPSLQDPVRCPVTQLAEDCQPGQWLSRSGGNSALAPERSRQFNAGAIVTPAAAVSATLDFWQIHKEHVIGTLDPSVLLANFARYAPTNILRGPAEAAFPGLPGPIQAVVLTTQNLGNLRISGLDAGCKWVSPPGRAGTLRFSFSGTYLLEWQQQLDGISYTSVLGSYGLQGPVPRWRHQATLDWDLRTWGLTLGQTFQGGYEDANVDRYGEPLTVPPRRVGSYSVADLQVRYAGIRELSIAAGITNVTDRAPPFTNQPQTPQVGYDPGYADPRMRAFYLKLTYSHL